MQNFGWRNETTAHEGTQTQPYAIYSSRSQPRDSNVRLMATNTRDHENTKARPLTMNDREIKLREHWRRRDDHQGANSAAGNALNANLRPLADYRSAKSIYAALEHYFAELPSAADVLSSSTPSTAAAAALKADGNVVEQQSHAFLLEQLRQAQQLDTELPDNPRHLPLWLEENVKNIGQQYHSYIAEREAGGGRKFFATRSHALYFLRAVAPTKLVDGAWLYGLLTQWRDPYVAPFIDIYLDELGHGMPEKNHVLLYRRLLDHEGINTALPLSDAHYVQGAIQLALAYHAEEFLPEIIGFNLGYEQLPLHLLITAYELAELGIDPYYFTLHVTIDNFDSGHAHKALQGALALMPKIDDGGEFYQRMMNGYRLNALGIGTSEIIEHFDMDDELVLMLQQKSELGRFMHADASRIEGRTVNEWLGDPQRMGDFIAALMRNGWIKRHQDPNRSRFWRMIAASNGAMAGVFNCAEQRLIYEWIGGAANVGGGEIPNVGRSVRRRAAHAESADINSDVQRLQQQLAQLDEPAAIDHLLPYLNPSLHYTPVGLAATQRFSKALRA